LGRWAGRGEGQGRIGWRRAGCLLSFLTGSLNRWMSPCFWKSIMQLPTPVASENVEKSFVDKGFLSVRSDRLEHMFEREVSPELTPLVAQIRAESVLIAAAEARRLRLVAQLADWVTAEAVAELASCTRVPGVPPDDEVIWAALEGEVQAVLGVAARPAVRLVELAQQLTRVLPATLDALQAGRLDLTRAKVLAEATIDLNTAQAREVETTMLEAAGDGPWD
jgi:phosphotransferase system HPr-like phosphotransfer protein